MLEWTCSRLFTQDFRSQEVYKDRNRYLPFTKDLGQYNQEMVMEIVAIIKSEISTKRG